MLHPDMQFRRDDYTILNGEWDFAFDDEDKGLKEEWYKHNLDMRIIVPYPYQSKLSGINITDTQDVIWYQRKINLPSTDKRIFLHFDAVDYETDVYINDCHIGYHEGGHTGFGFDISKFNGREVTLTLRVYDPSFDMSICRGKQTWEEKPHSIWYTRTSGIWQNVWLEYVDRVSLDNVKYYPDDSEYKVMMVMTFSDEAIGKKVSLKITGNGYNDETVIEINKKEIEYEYQLKNRNPEYLWTPDHPSLFDTVFTVFDDIKEYDRVESYFGIRTVTSEDGIVLLNHKPFYQKLLLNQGYTKDGLLSYEKDEDYLDDILKMKEMGFNGCRLHQKTESRAFLYFADKYGIVAWQECAAFYEFTEDARRRLKMEWTDIVNRDFNHPSIIAWTPFNESWGIEGVYDDKEKQDYAIEIYNHIKSMDSTRFVNANDGWEIVKADIAGFHNYRHGQADETEKYQKYCHDLKTAENILNSTPGKHKMLADCNEYHGEPIMITEFGGIAYNPDQNSWGYTTVKSEDELIADYSRMIDAIYASDVICGFCYTQFTDVEQEQNGLLDAYHRFKVNPKRIKEINDRK